MKKVIVIGVLFVLLLTSFALAGDNAVALESSSVQDGQSDVAVDVVIELTFSNNVVNKSVAQNNASSIALRSNGEGVRCIIDMADDQIEPELKRIINVIPVEPLEEGTSYELTISGALSGKNGNTIGEDVTISFTTQGAEKSGFTYWWLMVIVLGGIVVAVVVAIRNTKRGQSK